MVEIDDSATSMVMRLPTKVQQVFHDRRGYAALLQADLCVVSDRKHVPSLSSSGNDEHPREAEAHEMSHCRNFLGSTIVCKLPLFVLWALDPKVAPSITASPGDSICHACR